MENISCVENDSLAAGFHDNSGPKKILMCCSCHNGFSELMVLWKSMANHEHGPSLTFSITFSQPKITLKLNNGELNLSVLTQLLIPSIQSDFYSKVYCPEHFWQIYCMISLLEENVKVFYIHSLFSS